MKVKIVKKSDWPLPKYESKYAAGMDIRGDFQRIVIDSNNKPKQFYNCELLYTTAGVPLQIKMHPGGRCLVPTGLFIQLPHKYEAQVRPRSGLALKKGITVLNTPGTIDSDYRGEIGVILINTSNKDVIIEDGDRIAQLVISKYKSINWNKVETLEYTARGENGFGSTKLK